MKHRCLLALAPLLLMLAATGHAERRYFTQYDSPAKAPEQALYYVDLPLPENPDGPGYLYRAYYRENDALYAEGARAGAGPDADWFGDWRYLYPDGDIKQRGHSDDQGRLDGDVISYFENGRIEKLQPYTAGKLDGTEKRYDEDGDLRSRSIRVRLTDGSSKRATVIGYSATYDVAVLSIDDNFGTPAQLATEDAYVGQRILAVGNPPSGARQVYGNVLELDLPVMHRYVPDRTNQPVNMFVVTNRVVHGYSGGPMVDASTGVVYGITVGQVQYYNDPETGERKRVRPYAGAAMHISDVMTEVDRILADNDA